MRDDAGRNRTSLGGTGNERNGEGGGGGAWGGSLWTTQTSVLVLFCQFFVLRWMMAVPLVPPRLCLYANGAHPATGAITILMKLYHTHQHVHVGIRYPLNKACRAATPAHHHPAHNFRPTLRTKHFSNRWYVPFGRCSAGPARERFSNGRTHARYLQI